MLVIEAIDHTTKETNSTQMPGSHYCVDWPWTDYTCALPEPRLEWSTNVSNAVWKVTWNASKFCSAMYIWKWSSNTNTAVHVPLPELIYKS